MRTKELKLARLFIVAEIMLISMIPLVIVDIPYFLGYESLIPKSVVVAAFILQPFISIIGIVYRLSKKHDHKRVVKWQQQGKGRFLRVKEKFLISKANLQKEGYIIKSITLQNSFGVIKIGMHQEILQKALPVIKINSIQVPIIEVVDSYIICNITKAISTSLVSLNITSGDYEYSFDNPYYIADIESGDIIWQNEGHSYERNIYIKHKFVPYINKETTHLFNLFIDDKQASQHEGEYNEEKNMLIVNIPNINSHICKGKRCYLKSPLDGGRKIELPIPTIISVNGKKLVSI